MNASRNRARAVAAVVALGMAIPTMANISATAATRAGTPCPSAKVGSRAGSLVCARIGGRTLWQPASAVPAVAGSAPVGGAALITGSGSKDPIPVGVAVALSGTSSTAGQEQLAAARAAEQYLNGRGGVRGRPIRLVVADTGVTEAGASSAVAGLVNDAKVVAIVGPTLASQAGAVAEVATKARIAVVSPAAVPKASTLGRTLTSVGVPAARYTATAIAHVVRARPVKAAVVVAADDAASQDEAAAFVKALRDNGVAVQTSPTIAAKSPDLAPAVRFATTASPDLVVIAAPAGAAGMVRRLRDAGFRGEVVGGTELGAAAALAACGPACEGLWFSSVYAPAIPATGVNASFRSLFLTTYEREPTQVGAQAFAAVQVVVEALAAAESAGSLGAPLAALRPDLASRVVAGAAETPLGRISFDANGEAVPSRVFTVCTHIVRGDQSDSYAGELIYVTA